MTPRKRQSVIPFKFHKSLYSLPSVNKTICGPYLSGKKIELSDNSVRLNALACCTREITCKFLPLIVFLLVILPSSLNQSMDMDSP